jgi:nitrogen regulatory protein PII
MSLPSKRYTLFWCIQDFGKGSRVLELFNELGGIGGTIFVGKGTVKSELLHLLGIMETRKEIVVTIINEDREDTFFDEVSQKFGLDKPKHGIAFSMPVMNIVNVNDSGHESNQSQGAVGSGGAKNLDYKAIFVIVNRGLADDVLEAAESAGSTGGTVMHGRGFGSKEKETLFGIKIEPEKELVLIISKATKTEAIINAIAEKINVHEPNTGIIFVMDVDRTLGLYQK